MLIIGKSTIKADSYYYEGAVDASSVDTSTAHLTRAYKQYFGFSIEYALLTNYNSSITTIANPIMKAAILNS